jgi:hypothetical protein
MWIDQRGSEILEPPECLRLLAVAAKEDHIGRLAVNGTQSPLVVPLNFTFHDNGALVRIGLGRLSELLPGSTVKKARLGASSSEVSLPHSLLAMSSRRTCHVLWFRSPVH